MNRPGIVHVTAAEGGGADRYLRDLAACTQARHWIWHAGAGMVEDVARHRYFAAPSADAAARWCHDAGIGLVHLHGLTPACRAALAMLRDTGTPAPMPYVVTLHDVQFVAADAFTRVGIDAVDPAWLADVRGVLTGAAAVIAPSAFIADLALTHHGVATVRIEPGIQPGQGQDGAVHAAPALDGAPPQADFVVAVIGALGPHKGSLLLAPIGQALAQATPGAALVVIGYTDTQVARGMDVTGSYFVHGPYEDAELPALLRTYGVDVVLFPNRLAESFSYTLSETWAARVPVIVPDDGALGERVSAHGGGWLLPPAFTADDVATLVRRLRSAEARAEWAQVNSALADSDTARVPLLSAMAESFDALYQRFAQRVGEGAAPDAALAALVAANLDGAVFRRELTDLARERETMRAWVAKLEHDIAGLNASMAGLQQRNRELEDVRAAFETLPEPARKALFKWAFRGRG